jgi:hypothetical protein
MFLGIRFVKGQIFLRLWLFFCGHIACGFPSIVTSVSSERSSCGCEWVNLWMQWVDIFVPFWFSTVRMNWFHIGWSVVALNCHYLSIRISIRHIRASQFVIIVLEQNSTAYIWYVSAATFFLCFGGAPVIIFTWSEPLGNIYVMWCEPLGYILFVEQ